MIVAARSQRLLNLLSSEEVRAIHDASLRVLTETGLIIPLAPERRAEARGDREGRRNNGVDIRYGATCPVPRIHLTHGDTDWI